MLGEVGAVADGEKGVAVGDEFGDVNAEEESRRCGCIQGAAAQSQRLDVVLVKPVAPYDGEQQLVWQRRDVGRHLSCRLHFCPGLAPAVAALADCDGDFHVLEDLDFRFRETPHAHPSNPAQAGKQQPSCLDLKAAQSVVSVGAKLDLVDPPTPYR